MNWHQLTGLGQLKSFARYRFKPIEANCTYSSVNLLLFAKGISSEVSPLPTAVMNNQVSKSRMFDLWCAYANPSVVCRKLRHLLNSSTGASHRCRTNDIPRGIIASATTTTTQPTGKFQLSTRYGIASGSISTSLVQRIIRNVRPSPPSQQ